MPTHPIAAPPGCPWRPLRRIGGGTRMDVFEAEGPGGRAALKVPRVPGLEGDLFIEGELLRALGHTGVVEVLDACPDGGWLAMELLPGPDLVGWARGRPLADVVGALAAVADTTAELHLAGVVHGDLKPGNVLMDEAGHPRVLDLGLSSTGWELGFHGTFGAAAPEQLRGEPPTEASDVFALGVLAFRALTGGRPFSVHREAQALLPTNRIPWSAAQVRPGLPGGLDDLVARMLSRQPQRRPEMGRLAASLRAAAATPPYRPHPSVFLHWRTIGAALASAADGQAPPVLVALGDAPAARAALRTALARAAAREGLAPSPHPHAEAWCWTTDAAAAIAHAERPGGGLVVLESDRPVAALVDLGAPHLDLRLGHRPAPPPGGEAVLAALMDGPLDVEALADDLDRSPHDVLDLAEPLLDLGLLVELDEGRTLALADVSSSGP